MTLLSDNGVSKVWRDQDWVYKKQPKFLTDNEIWCLRQMREEGYAPFAEHLSMDVIRTKWIPKQPVTDPDAFMAHLPKVLEALRRRSIRHGDLTKYAVLVKDNKPMLVDFAESRLTCDPRPDKRREGDEYWLEMTMRQLTQEAR